jgi:hypothetical protein
VIQSSADALESVTTMSLYLWADVFMSVFTRFWNFAMPMFQTSPPRKPRDPIISIRRMKFPSDPGGGGSARSAAFFLHLTIYPRSHSFRLLRPAIAHILVALPAAVLSLYHRFVIALHSPDGVFETGLLGCPPEKKAAKLAGEIEQDTFSGPV